MEGNKKFDYEAAAKKETQSSKKDPQEIVTKVLQVVVGILMAIFHA
ncbi:MULTISPECIES: hypothetical protein [unclassified Chryseobacterium]|nr:MULTISPECIES: hypothetical protein [unclassified Chryseobacterium]